MLSEETAHAGSTGGVDDARESAVDAMSCRTTSSTTTVPTKKPATLAMTAFLLFGIVGSYFVRQAPSRHMSGPRKKPSVNDNQPMLGSSCALRNLASSFVISERRASNDDVASPLVAEGWRVAGCGPLDSIGRAARLVVVHEAATRYSTAKALGAATYSRSVAVLRIVGSGTPQGQRSGAVQASGSAALMSSRVTSKGDSDSSNALKSNVERIINLFRQSTEERLQQYPKPWREMGEAACCEPAFYSDFAGFLLHEYVIEGGQYDGEFLSCASVTNYLSCAINMASDRFKATGSNQAKLFFTCLDTNANTDSAQWLRGIKANITRIT